MKQIFKKTNRFLAAFLAVAMVLTMLPISQATAWASEVEEQTIAVDESGSKEAETSANVDPGDGSDATGEDPTAPADPTEEGAPAESSPASIENVGSTGTAVNGINDEVGDVDPVGYTDDVTIGFINIGADTDADYGTKSHVRILDGETRNQNHSFYGATSGAIAYTALKKWDSDQAYTFTLEAKPGYVFDTSIYNKLDEELVDIYYTDNKYEYSIAVK